MEHVNVTAFKHQKIKTLKTFVFKVFWRLRVEILRRLIGYISKQFKAKHTKSGQKLSAFCITFYNLAFRGEEVYMCLLVFV